MDYAAIFKYFHNQRQEFIALLSQLVSRPSPTGTVEKINSLVDFLADLFAPFHPRISRTPTTAGDILTLTLRPQIPEPIVFLAHLDTVPVADSTAEIRIEDDRLYGSGAYDMKNGIALFYFVLKAIEELPMSLDNGLTIILTPDEENGSHHSMPFLLQECRSAKAVILPEPPGPDGEVKIRRKAVATLQARLTGKASHSGIEPEAGKDANRGLARLIAIIDESLKGDPEVSFNPGVIRGGGASNIVSPWSELQGELRSFSNRQLHDVADRLAGIRRIDEIKTAIHVTIEHPALEFNEKNQRLYAVARKIAESLGYELGHCSSGGASDASNLSSAEIPVIDGLGMRGGGAHASDEFVRLDDFSFRATLLLGLFKDL